MIKINLLTEVKQAQRKKGKGGGGEGAFNLNNALMLACVALGLAYCGFMYFKISSQAKVLDVQIADREREKARLEKILEEVARFEKKKANLQKKIDLINELKRNQKGPVKIMDEVSRMIPDLLWLDSLGLKNSDALTIRGRALNLNAVANFIDNVKGNALFTEPTLQDISQTAGPSYSFVLGFNYVSPEAKKAAEEQKGAGAKPAAPPAKNPPKPPAGGGSE
jgi:type IV pilus assembly protein PilN